MALRRWFKKHPSKERVALSEAQTTEMLTNKGVITITCEDSQGRVTSKTLDFSVKSTVERIRSKRSSTFKSAYSLSDFFTVDWEAESKDDSNTQNNNNNNNNNDNNDSNSIESNNNYDDDNENNTTTAEDDKMVKASPKLGHSGMLRRST